MNLMQQIPGNVVQLREEMEGFPLTLAACEERENHQWAIGDALIKECGPPAPCGVKDGSHKRLEKAAEYLSANGYDHTLRTLQSWRECAALFPPSTRLTGVSWAVHNKARNLETLNKIIKANPGVPLTRAFVAEYRADQQMAIAHARSNPWDIVPAPLEKAVRVDSPALTRRKTSLENMSTKHPFHGLKRGEEIAPLYLRGEVAKMIGQMARERRGGADIWSLILQAKDAGFLTQTGMEPTHPTFRLLFPSAPLSWAKNYMLTDANHRAYIRDELMPAAIVNKDAILAEPEKIEIILRDHFSRQKSVAKKVVEEKKLVVAREATEHDDVVLFGKRYWPIVDKTQFDYDFEQLTAAFWTFDEMHRMAGANGTSPGACAHGIRFAIGRLHQYVSTQDMNSPVRANMRRLLNVVISLANALEENPNGECLRPPLPR